MNAKRILLTLLFGSLPVSATALNLSQSPLFLAGTEPRAMLVVSRDHQLSIKAYTDYSDLDGDGALETTYKDSIVYFGYFDPNKCYTYSGSSFAPSAPVSSGTHQCDGSKWSGNFLNWASMTRMDVLRKALYGGYRSTDTVGSGYETVLERQFLPVDVHAFVKVYVPTGSMPSVQSLTGLTGQTSVSLCNVSDTSSTTLTGRLSPLPNPVIKVAAGSWPQWDASEVTQCAVNIGNSTQPTALLGAYVARVKVCDAGAGLENNCKEYRHPTTGAQTIKPVGLLQQYGDVDVDRRVRFGLMTGSYAANKSGGVLRKNVGLIANNSNADLSSSALCGNNSTSDEIDACTGQFINQGATQAGIINVLNRLRLSGFQYTSGGRNDKHRYSCDNPGITSFSNGQCVDWGNPLGETYLETLRYFANAGATSTFDVSDASILSSIPKVAWADPLPSDEWCALSSIVVVSTGLNSFDTDELASFTPSGGSPIDANALTHTVGDASHEGINGGSYLVGNLIGGSGPSADNQCTAKTGVDLEKVKGICPETPSTEGGYAVAGLAYAPKTIDLRPGYATLRDARWGVTAISPDWALRQPMNTYAIQLAESLPSFSVSVGSGTVTLLPACQANSTGGAGAWTSSATGWRNCSMTNLVVDKNVADALVGSDTSAKSNTCSGNGSTSRCFTVSWEDSTWGNDYDMDGVQRLGFCVGSACASFRMLCPSSTSAYAVIGPWTGVGAGEMRVAACAIQAQAGHALTFGYTITGTTNDGAFFPVLRPGGANFSVGGNLAGGVTAASSALFTQGLSPAGLLKSPLWMSAKYGGFTESTPSSGTPAPNLSFEWDAENNSTGAKVPDGIPDNYFDVRNPANLITALGRVFDRAAQVDASASSVATNSTNLRIGSRIYQARFSSADWSGQLLSYNLSLAGVLATTPEWDGGEKLLSQTPSSRVIFTRGATDGVAFDYSDLTLAQKALLDTDTAGVTDGCGPERVAYLRGDASHEDANGSFACASGNTTGNFRQRLTPMKISGVDTIVHFKLGDIIDSNPWYVGSPEAGYSDVVHSGYSDFRSSKLNRKPVVYVGGNDGMLHGFDASVQYGGSNPQEGAPTTASGSEVLAYIPSAVFPNLSRLTERRYNRDHRYFVNGSPMIGDADIDSSSADDWRSVLVGGLGAGGKGYYALDVSDPSSFSEGNAANLLLWEFTQADDADLGYGYNLPPASMDTNAARQIVKMANGKWAVVLGNGYNSTSGKAVLYILFIEDGVDGAWGSGDYVKIVADAPTGLDNGLSTPLPVDTNYDGYADTVYAGDLKGRLWKFLVGPNGGDAAVTATPSTWKVAFSSASCGATSTSTCSPLFAARDDGGQAQPIISPVDATPHPDGGVLVMFGTGKYLERTDTASSFDQTFYGVWDRNDGSSTVGARSADLLEQTVTATHSAAGGTFRAISNNPIAWRPASGGDPADCTGSCTPTHMGWYMDFPTPGERTTGIPKLVNKVIFFNTLIPSTAPCESGGTGWLMALDYLTGGKVTSHRIFDTGGDNLVDSDDLEVGGNQTGAAMGGTTLIPNAADADSTVGAGVSSLTTGALTAIPINFGAGLKGRLSWREIVQ